MSELQADDKSIDLEESALDEFGRLTVCDSEAEGTRVVESARLQGPHTGRRCPPEQRELLRNQFPADPAGGTAR